MKRRLAHASRNCRRRRGASARSARKSARCGRAWPNRQSRCGKNLAPPRRRQPAETPDAAVPKPRQPPSPSPKWSASPKPRCRQPPPPLAPLGRRERSQLSRGRKEIDARLDLHGMTQTRAHRALFGFLQRAHADGLTFVLVITGKGKTRRRIRTRRAAPPGAAMAGPAGIPHAGGRVSRKPISAMAARARSTCGSGDREFERS